MALGKSPDASDADKRRLASAYRDEAGNAEINAIGKTSREQEDAAARAEALRKIADDVDPDK